MLRDACASIPPDIACDRDRLGNHADFQDQLMQVETKVVQATARFWMIYTCEYARQSRKIWV